MTNSMRRSIITLVVALSAFGAATPAVAQVVVKAGAAELKFSGRVQFQGETSTCTDATPAVDSGCEEEAPGLDLFLRRARVSLEAKIDERLSLKIEPDFASIRDVSLKDAWGRYAFSVGLAFRAGHFMRPFDGFFMTSSSHLPFERAVEVSGVEMIPSYSGLSKGIGLSDRDVGATLEGTPGEGVVSYWLGVFQGGSSSNSNDTNTSKQFFGRVQVAVEAAGQPLELASALALSDAPYTAADDETEAEYYRNFELWAQLGAYDRAGLLLQAGLILGDNPALNDAGGAIDLASGEDFASLLTWQGVAAYRIPVESADWLEAIAPLLRVSYGDPNTDADDDQAWGFTPGLSLYFHGRNRLALTWDIVRFGADGVGGENSFKAQMQFHF